MKKNLLLWAVLAMIQLHTSVANAQTDRAIAAWLDEHVASAVERREATAAAAVVVRNGTIVVNRTFGWFDPAANVEVKPAHQFKIGSITKSFTGLAVTRLLEDGLIESLDDPVNKYLKRIELPGVWGAEVTITHLLTHASGLSSPALGITGDDQDSIPASAAFLARRLPDLVREPGLHSVYANYGMAVVQALVEDVTGQRFDEYLMKRILLPLGMNESELGIDRTGGPKLVRAGLVVDGEIARNMRLSTNAPFIATSGSMQVTPGDMARYMLAHLGHFNEVVTPRMRAVQQNKVRSNYPGLSSIGLGLFSHDWNGVEIWSHGGLVAGYRSSMALLPSLDLGIFVVFVGGSDPFSASGGNPSRAVDMLVRDILGPFEALPAIQPVTAPEKVTGRYWTEGRAHSSPDIMLAVISATTVSPAGDGGILVNGEAMTEIAPGLFRKSELGNDGLPPRRLAMHGDEILSSVGFEKRVTGLSDPGNWLAVFAVAAVACLSGLFAAFYSGRKRQVLILIGTSSGAFLYLVTWYMFQAEALFSVFSAEIAWRYTVGSVIGWLLIPCGIYAMYAAFQCWKDATRLSGRLVAVHTAVVGAGALSFTWVLAQLQLLG